MLLIGSFLLYESDRVVELEPKDASEEIVDLAILALDYAFKCCLLLVVDLLALACTVELQDLR